MHTDRHSNILNQDLLLEGLVENIEQLKFSTKCLWMISIKLSLQWQQNCVCQYCTVQYSAVQYSTVQYSTVQYSAVQYSTEGLRRNEGGGMQFPIVVYMTMVINLLLEVCCLVV